MTDRDGTLGPEARHLSDLIIAGDDRAIIAYFEQLDTMAAVTILTDALTAPDRIIDLDDVAPLAHALGLGPSM